jgi:hypothetical protein
MSVSLNNTRNRPPTYTSISQLVSSIQISWIKLCMHFSSPHARPISPFFSSLSQWRYSHGFCGLLAPGYWDLGFESYENENMSAFFSSLRLCSQRPCDGLIPYPTSLTLSLQIRFRNPNNRRPWAALACSANEHIVCQSKKQQHIIYTFLSISL